MKGAGRDYQQTAAAAAEFCQLVANARENATEAEAAFIDNVERLGWQWLTVKDSNRLQEIADR